MTSPPELEVLMGAHMLSWPGAQRLLAGGVPGALLAELNGRGLIGQARVELSRDGSRFAIGGADARLLLGVTDEAGELVDLVACASHDENQWALLTGYGTMLGAGRLRTVVDAMDEAQLAERPFHARMRVFATPWDWLRGGGEGICVLDWGRGALADLRMLGEGVTIVVDAGARERMRALLAHGGLPLVAEAPRQLGRAA